MVRMVRVVRMVRMVRMVTGIAAPWLRLARCVVFDSRQHGALRVWNPGGIPVKLAGDYVGVKPSVGGIAMPCRGVRGATTAEANTSEAILKATRELLALMIRQNDIQPEDVASAIFTTTPDLDNQFPALAARQIGWFDVALMCFNELDVPGSLRRCIRILIHWNTSKPADQLVHVYVREASGLRADRSNLPPVDWDELEEWIAEHVDEAARPSR